MSEATAKSKRKPLVYFATLASAPLAGLIMSFVLVLIGYAADALSQSHSSVMPIPELAAVYLIYGPIFGALIGWPASLIVGLPAHKLMSGRGWTTLWHYILGGAAGSIFPLLILAALAVAGAARGGGSLVMMFAIYIPFGGVLTSAIFWLIRRPDRDLRPTLSPEAAHV